MLLDIWGVAHRLCVSASTVERRIASGEFEAGRVGRSVSVTPAPGPRLCRRGVRRRPSSVVRCWKSAVWTRRIVGWSWGADDRRGDA
jgi:hypothetical protein